jgi:hypothetical protein
VEMSLLIAAVVHALILFCIGSYWFRKTNDTAVKYL